MSTSLVTKARKKQPALSVKDAPAVALPDRKLEQAILSLENCCVYILDIGFTADRRDTDLRYWQQRFKNMMTPVSLALAECKGPRRFHFHYRHRADDEAVLHPVLEPSPLTTLEQVCAEALGACRSQLVGIEDSGVLEARHMLEMALQGFLLCYRKYKNAL
jgi:hypothetical protein